ncbi:ABC multidrug transporter mdr1 [Cladobotryum mycophilum]|uniref:ABC multidrug transporter mdr1 n=1 Tax=Cladobotryum mycophilum TaxID=491253 RepID=A0ABR0SU05_9HYPO
MSPSTVTEKEKPKNDNATTVPDTNDPFRHLEPAQAEILRCQVITPDVPSGIKAIYRYASTNDIIILVVSSFCAIAAGAALPIMALVFGNLQGIFQNSTNGQTTYEHYTHELTRFVVYFIYLGVGVFVTSYISTVGFIYAGEHISAKIRQHYLESCLRQNIGFFDNIGAGEITTRITSDTNLIQTGISEKVSLSLNAIATFASAFVVGMITEWKLTMILFFPTVFSLILVSAIISSMMIGHNKSSLEAYAEGGSVADEVFGSIRTAVASGSQDRLAKQYDKHLDKAEYHGYRVERLTGGMTGAMFLILILGYGLAFWRGARYLVDGKLPVSKLLIVLMSVLTGAFSLSSCIPHMQAFMTAVAAAAKIYNTIDRVSPLDPMDDKGEKLDHLEGHIRLENIQHIYPSRPEKVVMHNVSLDIPARKTTALVGASGSGKSTIIGLVERFYNPISGTVYLDDHDISTLNIKWLRQQMALVSQEPVLFATTIFDNIRYGLIGTAYESESEEKQRELAVSAAKKANAHEFISALPLGYETKVGERGFLLSGGQKQRIAIARAVISNPKILLLDEATSALDTKSEGVVQAALEAASEGRTTIIIAHRLSTIRDADNIIVMAEGQVIEQGTHNQLVEQKGAYYKLVSAQAMAPSDGEESTEEEDTLDEVEELQKKFSNKKYSYDMTELNGGAAVELSRTRSLMRDSIALDGDELQEGQEYGLWTCLKFIYSFNSREWHLMLLGLLISVICGAAEPVISLFYAKQVLILSRPVTSESRHGILKDSDFWSAMFVMLAFVQFFARIAQGVLFAVCSQRLVHLVRYQVFRAILRQDIAFFDKEENTAGALTTFLSTEPTKLAGLSGATLGTLLATMTTVFTSIILSIAIGWKLALVCTATVPILLVCGFARLRMLGHFEKRSKAAYALSASYASEAVSAIRTVASLTREQDVLEQYSDSLAAQQRRSLKSVAKSSLLYGGSQGLIFCCIALGFWYGGTLIGKGEYDQFQFFVCFMSVILGGQSAGSFFAYAADMSHSQLAATRLKELLDRQPKIDAWSSEGESVKEVNGVIEFRDVHFRYPTRPQQPILKGLNLKIQPGQYVALVGASGCGKSTTISLLERFYDTTRGTVLVDGKDISSLNLSDYRSFIALVSQEPTLYQGTIKENILLGSTNEVSDEMIEFSCREANIYDFIQSLPDGFNTMVGSKGTLLSGGQKQRIAIARALVRDPKILLLDEATSALDSESEHVVQAALDEAAKGRTTIAVAHRLSTVQKADIIYVFDQGRIVESGTHSELIKLNGRYAELVNLQSLAKHE